MVAGLGRLGELDVAADGADLEAAGVEEALVDVLDLVAAFAVEDAAGELEERQVRHGQAADRAELAVGRQAGQLGLLDERQARIGQQGLARHRRLDLAEVELPAALAGEARAGGDVGVEELELGSQLGLDLDAELDLAVAALALEGQTGAAEAEAVLVELGDVVVLADAALGLHVAADGEGRAPARLGDRDRGHEEDSDDEPAHPPEGT